MKFVVIIPSRYASTRFPGKPLVEIQGKSMIRRVYEQASSAKLIDAVYVATDDDRIAEHVKDFGGNIIMTATKHESGTDRLAEAYQSLTEQYDYIINVQGDEPFINPKQIDNLAQLMIDKKSDLGTMVKVIEDEETLFNPNTPKVILGNSQETLYFSRQTIPFIRGVEKQDWLKHHTFYKHIGMYAYRSDVLMKITQLNISSLEKAESLEQLRWLENGYTIHTITTNFETIGIDTPEDLERLK